MSVEEHGGQRAAGGSGSLPPSRDAPEPPRYRSGAGASLAHRLGGFYLPIDVSLLFIPFDFRAGFS